MVGTSPLFNSWVELCEYVIDFAEEQVNQSLPKAVKELICELADEIIETAEEYGPEATY